MKPYIHKVQYYETDMMGVAHHANYIRWMEEARVDFMDQLGFPYRDMEKAGVVSPVRSVSADFRHPCAFADEIRIEVSPESFNGVVLSIKYTMRNKDGETVCAARSEHVFLTREGRFVRLRREMPDFCKAIDDMIAENKAETGNTDSP